MVENLHLVHQESTKTILFYFPITNPIVIPIPSSINPLQSFISKPRLAYPRRTITSPTLVLNWVSFIFFFNSKSPLNFNHVLVNLGVLFCKENLGSRVKSVLNSGDKGLLVAFSLPNKNVKERFHFSCFFGMNIFSLFIFLFYFFYGER
ncbi:hypothetical protein RchiOBHm_Chr2g0119861 [Rosa chinensis]|uniref:Uncharacterized protein n=1 Tax=Rosa chinensis TaxID=74649 RepID=A0A2P6RS40_ROSCH|nr:hypothetical protein RchiOBHm_Chr2g0119861 [Rosa chinensis]